ncbi:MAG: (4Fe-4S)-binding protein [Bacillota bacterium]|nr:(4Fe-4S)-binding protein [Bacillota bacterium]
MASGSVDITYRGIFQKILAGNIVKTLVKASRHSGKIGGTISRYSDSPERNGIPAKQFAVIAESEDELHVQMAKYEPDNVRLIAALDDTLAKGHESWAWYGIRPIHLGLAEGGALLVVSDHERSKLLEFIPQLPFDWRLGILPGQKSFSGLWVYHDDGTEFRVLGAIAHLIPEVVRLEDLEKEVAKGPKAEQHLEGLRQGYREVQVSTVPAGVGAPYTYEPVRLPEWNEMAEAIIVPAAPRGGRQEAFKKFTTRSERPVINFDACTQCKQCFMECPDSVFELTPEGTYRVEYEACCGCGICAEVCPVDDCIVMVDELAFDDNHDLYADWKADKAAYARFFQTLLDTQRVTARSSRRKVTA